MNRPFSALLATVVLAFSVDASAFAACGEHFPSGNAPVVSDTHLRVQVLCYERFVVLHSGLTNGPLLVAEHLVAHHVRSAKGQIRVNLFHPEPRLNPPERAELSDFARSGYDRGHMAPSGDMPDANSQAESFTLANMVPQDAQNNRYLWEAIESATRAYVQRAGEAIVMTGPLFLGKRVESIGSGVLVPTHIFKLVYDPSRRAATVFLTENNSGKGYALITAMQLQQLTRVYLPRAVTAAATSLAMPALRARSDRSASTSSRRQSVYFEDAALFTRALARKGSSQ